MERDIPLKIEILSSEEDDQYLITSAKEIEFILHNIAQNGTRCALYYSDTDDFILTTLLAVDASGLWLELSQHHQLNAQVATSRKLIFVGTHYQVKVQFVAATVREEFWQGQPALFIPFPLGLHRLQRREYFRLITPVLNPLHCVIPEARPVASPPPLDVTIMDISGGGVGLTCEEHHTALAPGQVYRNCRIGLPDIGELVGTIEVRNIVVLNMPSGQTMRRAGCAFRDLDGAAEILLQRYVTAMQRNKN